MPVIPSKDGIQSFEALLDPGFRQGDDRANRFLLMSPASGVTECDWCNAVTLAVGLGKSISEWYKIGTESVS